MKKTSYFLSILFLICSCNSEQNLTDTPTTLSTIDDETIDETVHFAGIDNAPKLFVVNSQKGGIIDLSNGGEISIPANAFVTKNGEPITDNINVEWNEYHSLTDIMLSGIEMKYDSAGMQYDFVSGGMFRIDANYKGEKVFLAPDKTIGVRIASSNPELDFNFYERPDAESRWNYLSTERGTPIPSKKVEETTYMFDAEPSNLKEFPEFYKRDIVGWKTNTPISKKQQKGIIQNSRNSKLKKEQNSENLHLEIVVAKDTLSYPVTPFFMEDAKKESAKNKLEMQNDINDIFAYQDNLAQGKVMRDIQIPGLGTYNWDVIYKIDSPKILHVVFETPNNTNPKMVPVFLICPESNYQVKFTPTDWNKFSFDPKKKNYLIGILPDNSVVSLGNEAFIEAAKAPNKSEYIFKLKDAGFKIETGKDLASYLNTLSKS